jgi:energy-coupling factor transporter transmembrane protein EcfT
MTIADIELARMIYLASILGALLFASLMLRGIGLWRPLRFLLIAWLFSLLFTPFFVEQSMPDGSQQNMVPAFVVMTHDAINDKEHWREQIMHAGKPIVTVGTIASVIALVLGFLLPKPARPIKKIRATDAEKPVKKQKKNPYLPEDFQPQ